MKLAVISVALCVLTACSRDGTSEGVAADNTARNARDKDGATLTPTDQSENEDDRRLTQQVRQALMDADLSTLADNIKIITLAGKVTLRGVVSSQAEKDEVVRLARSLTGVVDVDDQLEVKG